MTRDMKLYSLHIKLDLFTKYFTRECYRYRTGSITRFTVSSPSLFKVSLSSLGTVPTIIRLVVGLLSVVCCVPRNGIVDGLEDSVEVTTIPVSVSWTLLEVPASKNHRKLQTGGLFGFLFIVFSFIKLNFSRYRFFETFF